MHEFDVVIIEDETSGYVAFVPALPGCHTQGDTLEELMEKIEEATELYLKPSRKTRKKNFYNREQSEYQKRKAHARDVHSALCQAIDFHSSILTRFNPNQALGFKLSQRPADSCLRYFVACIIAPDFLNYH